MTVYSASQMSPDSNKRPGIPPSHPNNNNPNAISLPFPHMVLPSSHYRPLLDSLPPLSPSMSSFSDPNSGNNTTSVCIDERVVNSLGLSIPSPVNRVTNNNGSRVSENLPPRRGHRRSSSDIPLGFSAMIQSSTQLIPIGSKGAIEKPIQLVKQESEWNNVKKDASRNVEGMGERKSEEDVADDLFNEYMNLENIDTLNSSCTEDKDMDSRASRSKTNGCESSDNEVESRVYGRSSSGILSEKREGIKRSACGDIAPTVRHCRSVSMDSYMGNLPFDDESLRPPAGGQLSPGNPSDGNLAKMSLEFNGEFNDAELKKIWANEKLAEIALSDPKRAKRYCAFDFYLH